MSLPRRIVIGVTTPVSFVLMEGLPEALAADGWEVHVVSAPGAEVADAPPGARHHVIPMARRPSLRADVRALMKWVRLLRALIPDAVLVGTPKAGLLGILAAKACGVRVRMYHLRGLRLETAGKASFALYWLLEKLAFSGATSVLAVSPSLRRRALELKLCSPRKVAVLGLGSSNGVDVERFRPGAADPGLLSTLPLAEAVPVVGFVGRLAEDKGVRELVDASLLLQEWGVAHQLLIAGKVEDEGIAAALAGLEASAHSPVFVGQVKDLSDHYRAMDLLCLPTYREGFPNVALEAAASGLPVVTTRATGAIDSVVDGETGLLVDPRDATALATSLAQLLRDAGSRREMGLKGRQWVEKHFARGEVQAEVVGHIRALAQHPRGVRR